MQSNSDNGVTAAMVAALVTRRPAVNETPSHNLMRVYLDKLKELVPHCPKNRSVSKLELIQHVIDYINDLQDTLQSGSDSESPPSSPLINPMSFTEAFSHLSFNENGSIKGLKSNCSYDESLPVEYSANATAYTSDGSSDYDSRGSSPINNSDTDYSSDEYTSSQYRQQYPTSVYPSTTTLEAVASTTLSYITHATPMSSETMRFYRKGYGLPAHLSS